jgi:hypothetical protein
VFQTEHVSGYARQTAGRHLKTFDCRKSKARRFTLAGLFFRTDARPRSILTRYGFQFMLISPLAFETEDKGKA